MVHAAAGRTDPDGVPAVPSPSHLSGELIVDTAYRVTPLRRGDPEQLGEYWLTGRLGSGGMGVVYLATDRDDNYVAIKLVHAALVNDPEFRGRFRSEVERARQVPSFCTAEVLDADLDHNPPYLDRKSVA